MQWNKPSSNSPDRLRKRSWSPRRRWPGGGQGSAVQRRSATKWSDVNAPSRSRNSTPKFASASDACCQRRRGVQNAAIHLPPRREVVPATNRTAVGIGRTRGGMSLTVGGGPKRTPYGPKLSPGSLCRFPGDADQSRAATSCARPELAAPSGPEHDNTFANASGPVTARRGGSRRASRRRPQPVTGRGSKLRRTHGRRQRSCAASPDVESHFVAKLQCACVSRPGPSDRDFARGLWRRWELPMSRSCAAGRQKRWIVRPRSANGPSRDPPRCPVQSVEIDLHAVAIESDRSAQNVVVMEIDSDECESRRSRPLRRHAWRALVDKKPRRRRPAGRRSRRTPPFAR